MGKQSNYVSSVAMLSGAILSSGFYLASFHFAPIAAQIFLITTIALAALGVVKALNHFAHSFPAPFNRAVCWIHSLSFEAVAIAASFFMRPLCYLGLGNGMSGTEKGRPILLIHGYLQNATNWALLKERLSRKGFGPIYTLNLTHPFRSIRDYAELVAQKADKIAQETKREDLTLIGHSMGGLVSAWYAAKVAPPDKVSDVITIASPMGGTKLAAIAIGPNGREMKLGSDFVCRLQDEFRQNKKIRFYHIASKTDQVVLPYSSALTGLYPEREYLIDDIGHMSHLYSSRVANKIEEWLASAAST
jgi:triacylglycerol lipase